MLRRYSFIPIFFLLLAGAGWWAGQVELAAPPVPTGVKPAQLVIQASVRRELMEALDRLVSYENYYHSVYGHFTKLLTRVGFTVPRSISELYDIRVAEASADRFLITAASEIEGKTIDFVSIDHEYRVQSNFPVPPPRAEYLRVLAVKHLRLLRDAAGNQPFEEGGLFRDYFRYEVKRDSEDRRIAFAVGLRPPVVGMQLEMGPQQGAAPGPEEALISALSDEENPDLTNPRGTGQGAVGNVMTTLEEVYLAQRIFRGEMGRYAKNWSELSRIAAFKFEDKDRFGDGGVPFGDSRSIPELEARSDTPLTGQEDPRLGRLPATQSDRAHKGLIIEPIAPGEAY